MMRPVYTGLNASIRPPARYMTLTPHPHLPRLQDPFRPSLPLDAADFNPAARLLTEQRGRDVAGAPLPPVRGLQDAKLQRSSFFRPPSHLSAAIRDDDHELASLLGFDFDIELQRCSVLVDPHCGNPKGLITALLSVNDPLKIPRWFIRRSRQVPVLLAPTAARVTRRCSSVKHKLRSVPYICNPKHDCIVCRTIIHERELRLRCGHNYHVECLLHLVEASTHDQSLFPPRCCDQPIREKVFERYMSPALASTYREKTAEFSTVRRVYCSNLTCSRFLGPRSDSKHAINYYCAVCATRTCSGCRLGVSTSPVGQPHICRADCSQREVLDLAHKKGWTRCPACDEMIELHSGCYHMTCVCATQFCYVCGGPWKTCPCPQWEQVELRDLDALTTPLVRPLPLDTARPPTPPPKPRRPEGGLSWQGSVSPSVGHQRQAHSVVLPKDNPPVSLDGRPRSLHPAGLAVGTQRGFRGSAYGISSHAFHDSWIEAADPLLSSSLGVDCRVLEGGLLAQRRRGIAMPRPPCV
ncbi:hypothetical protein C8Q72DRAFT_519436 [Fomitopsis betulina]|nr:hypothetical protein C8Q72DRAFT_519436 [Fomitopsis betulina]